MYSGGGAGYFHRSKEDQAKMSSWHGSSPPQQPKKRTKITAPRNGATSPEDEPRMTQSPGRPVKSFAFRNGLREESTAKDQRRRNRPMPNHAPPYMHDNLYTEPGSSSRQGRRNPSLNLNLNTISSSFSAGSSLSAASPHVRNGTVAQQVRRLEMDASHMQPNHRNASQSGSLSTNAVPPSSRRDAGTAPDRTVIDLDGDDSGTEAMLPETDRTPTPKPVRRRPREDRDNRDGNRDAGASNDSKGYKGAHEVAVAPQLLVKERKQKMDREKRAEAGSSKRNKQRRPPGVIQVEDPDDNNWSSIDPIDLLRQDPDIERGQRSQRQPPSNADPPASSSASGSSSQTLAATGLAQRMKSRSAASLAKNGIEVSSSASASASVSASASTSRRGGPGAAADDGPSASKPQPRSGRPAGAPDLTEVVLQSIIVSDFWQSDGKSPCFLLPHFSKMVFGQGAGAGPTQLDIPHSEIDKIECSKKGMYDKALVSIRLRGGTALDKVKATWEEFDDKAVEDAAGIVLIPKFEDHAQETGRDSWDRAIHCWSTVMTEKIHWLDGGAVETIKSSVANVPKMPWPQIDIRDSDRTKASRLSANPSPMRAKTAIRPGEHRREPFDGKTFELASPEDHQLASNTLSDVHQPSRRAARPQTKTLGRNDDGAGAEEPRIASKRPERLSNEQVLRFPFEGVGSVTLLESDLDRLDDGEFLNDTLIEFGLKTLLEEIRSRDPALADQIYVFNSFFYKRLTEFPVKKSYLNVRKWTNKVDLFSKRYIVLPINEDYHWYLAIVVNPHYMTMPGPPPLPVRKSLRHSLGDGEAGSAAAGTQQLTAAAPDVEMADPDAAPVGGLADDSDGPMAMDVDPDSRLVDPGRSRCSSGAGNKSVDRCWRSVTVASDGRSEISTPPPPPMQGSQGPSEDATMEPSRFNGSGQTAAEDAGSSSSNTATPVRTQTIALYPSRKRDAHGNVKPPSDRSDDARLSSQQVSIPPIHGAQPLPPSTQVQVIDLRTGKSKQQVSQESVRALEQPFSLLSSSGETLADDGDEGQDKPTALGEQRNGRSGFEMLDEERNRLQAAEGATDQPAGTARSIVSILDDSMDDDFPDAERHVSAEAWELNVAPSYGVGRQRSPSPLRQTIALRDRPGHRSGRRSMLPLSPGLASEQARDTSPGFEVIDDPMQDPLRGQRVGGGPAALPEATEVHAPRLPTKILPGAQRRAETPPPSSSSQQSEQRAPRSNPGSRSPRTYTSRDRIVSAAANLPLEPAASINLEQTMVITFDSLNMARRSLRKHMREYLYFEAQDKGKLQDPSMPLEKARQPHYIKAIVPKQPNYADCGIYLLHYFDRFFSDPDAFVELIATQAQSQETSRAKSKAVEESPEWRPEQVSGKRKLWRSRILELGEKWKAWKAKKDEEIEAQKERKRLKLEEERRESFLARAEEVATGLISSSSPFPADPLQVQQQLLLPPSSLSSSSSSAPLPQQQQQEQPQQSQQPSEQQQRQQDQQQDQQEGQWQKHDQLQPPPSSVDEARKPTTEQSQQPPASAAVSTSTAVSVADTDAESLIESFSQDSHAEPKQRKAEDKAKQPEEVAKDSCKRKKRRDEAARGAAAAASRPSRKKHSMAESIVISDEDD
ncbi:hypothetical protein ACQY0O_005430 [Thecaphora frezii]